MFRIYYNGREVTGGVPGCSPILSHSNTHNDGDTSRRHQGVKGLCEVKHFFKATNWVDDFPHGVYSRLDELAAAKSRSGDDEGSRNYAHSRSKSSSSSSSSWALPLLTAIGSVKLLAIVIPVAAVGVFVSARRSARRRGGDANHAGRVSPPSPSLTCDTGDNSDAASHSRKRCRSGDEYDVGVEGGSPLDIEMMNDKDGGWHERKRGVGKFRAPAAGTMPSSREIAPTAQPPNNAGDSHEEAESSSFPTSASRNTSADTY
eukprot:GHVU01148638.1.p1 GENE.GHVU01148638.1~~GHVU01148638.1.p1  ORF type:complete len:260 (-),score=31.56 GHVU01148638.1:974-1753(-)